MAKKTEPDIGRMALTAIEWLDNGVLLTAQYFPKDPQYAGPPLALREVWDSADDALARIKQLMP